MKKNIRVEYDGCYPNTCRGTLTIYINDNEVYKASGKCTSTGSIWFDNDWEEHVEEGELIWAHSEAEMFDEDVQQAVRDKLSQFHVCCGGCV